MKQLLVTACGVSGLLAFLWPTFAQQKKNQIEQMVRMTSIAEAQAGGTPIDFAVTIQKGGAVISVELYATSAINPGEGGWYTCDPGGPKPRCGGPVPAGFDPN